MAKLLKPTGVPNALSELEKDIDFDERYYTEEEISTNYQPKKSNEELYVSQSEKNTWNNKQDTMVLKTVNHESLLGQGNINIQGSGSKNMDGGNAASVYLPSQIVDGGNANG